MKNDLHNHLISIDICADDAKKNNKYKKIVENLAELANTKIMKNQKVMRLITAYFYLNHLQRFNTSFILIFAFIALFKTSVVYIYNYFDISAVFYKSFQQQINFQFW